MVKIHFRTFGCPTNFSESESMMGILSKAKFEIADNPEDALVIVLNICTVKGNTTSLREIRKTAEQYPNKKIIVAGCITQDIIPEIYSIAPEASLIGTHNIREIVEVVEETINDNPVQNLIPPKNPETKTNLPKIRKNKSVAIIPICSGCTGRCRYCSVRIVKGKLVSYPIEQIVEEAQGSIMHGARQIWITAQDTAAYMLDKEKKTKLPELIAKIAKLPGDFKIRIGMMNINNLYPVIDEMIGILQHEKVFRFLHLPAQSGSDEILEKMGRDYSARKFRESIKRIREAIPGITVSTDIITGFPGETKINFQESVKLIDEIQPDVLNVSKFRPRPGTEAAEMENQIPGEDAKQRSKYITSIFEWSAYRKNKKWVGWAGDIIIEEKGKEGTGTYIGRNHAYKPVIVEGSFNPGDVVKVRIDAFTMHDLRGRVS
ncbi:tRNA (N(6)-L-threonylcarbamoyladenosine(37)-C(2))-methylthiotransferase [Candidatus Woesearchaeota archaeon]|nr:tRNA (N(6)-L-threonylcarbamoyladenosine(37)-C(2))-methylthiotransferase [Candidatus Woesearchaeota archaeon]